MSTTTLEVIEGGRKTYRSVEVARKQEATSWEMADAIWEDVVANNPGLDRSRADGVRTGLSEIEADLASELQADGHDYKQSYVHDLFVTREAWPPSERVDGASFTAHYVLRAGSYPNRRANLERLRDRSANGKVTAHAVKVWVSEKKPRSHKSFLELVDVRVRAALKAAAKPWHTVAQDDRDAIARLLRIVADEVQDGSFPK